MPGFGFSYPSQTLDFSMRQCVDVVIHLMERLGSGPATLMFPCAWSYIAFQLAAEKPALIESLIVSQWPCWGESQAWSTCIDANAILRTPVLRQLSLAMNQKRFSDGWYDVALPKGRATKDFAEPARKLLSEGGMFCMASMIQAWSNVKHFSFLVDKPTVVMWGGSDRTYRWSSPDSVLQYLKTGKEVVYHEMVYFPELVDTERFKALLLNDEFWDGLKTKEIDTRLEGVSSIDEIFEKGVGDNDLETLPIAVRKAFG